MVDYIFKKKNSIYRTISDELAEQIADDFSTALKLLKERNKDKFNVFKDVLKEDKLKFVFWSDFISHHEKFQNFLCTLALTKHGMAKGKDRVLEITDSTVKTSSQWSKGS